VSSATALAPLVVRTVETPAAGWPAGGRPPVDLLPRREPLVWWRGAEGLLGRGVAARLEVSGPDRFEQAAAWWRARCAELVVEDQVGAPGTGPVAFASFAFDEDEPSVLVLPRVLIGRRDGRSWVTRVGDQPPLGRPEPVCGPASVAWSDGSVPDAQYVAAVADAVRRIRADEAAKVVLARDLVACADDDIDPRHLVSRLAPAYPDCFTYAVEGLVGATPELLGRRTGLAVQSRVLAGTTWRRDSGDDDNRLSEALLLSMKDRSEHEYAVRSAADALAQSCTVLDVPTAPSVVRLANVTHLSTDLTGTLREAVSVLELAGALHPTAAVAGTPTPVAQRLIRQLEGMRRGRYAGPVGWVAADGSGELGIALRCAQLDGPTARLYAGCGIVADSDPDTELAEAQAKLLAVRDALEPPGCDDQGVAVTPYGVSHPPTP